jgi:predicted negative regulator of RcsB-dependent stress response
MAIDDQEEYEQGERVRSWLRSNGTSIIGGIAVGLTLIAGWQWWQRKQDLHAQDAAMQYQALDNAVNAGSDEKRIAMLANSLHTDYAKTVYGTLASMRLAAHQVERGDAKAALATLDAVSGKSGDPGLEPLVRLRAARLLMALNRPKDALARIEPITDAAYVGVAAEIRGDAEVALGNLDAARTAYTEALTHTDAGAPTRAIIEMKLADIGGEAPKPEAKKA